MLGLPSRTALRNASVACVAGAGVALLGLSLTNVASMDATLAAATEQPAPVHRTMPVSFETKQDCPLEQNQTQTSTQRATSHLEY